MNILRTPDFSPGGIGVRRTSITILPLVIGVSLLLVIPGSAEAEILKFKMTNRNLPVLPGFKRVTADTAYTKDAGYGWTRGNRVEWRRLQFGLTQVMMTGTFPDIITGSWVAPGKCVRKSYVGRQFNFEEEAEFRVDVTPGKYAVYMILGDYYYMAGYARSLRRPYRVSVNGTTRVHVRRTEGEVAALYYKHEYTEYDPRISYWRRYVKERFDPLTYTFSAESDGSLRIAVHGIPVTMIAVWADSERNAAEKWLKELERTREESCELREWDRPAVKPLSPTPQQKEKGYVVFAGKCIEDIFPHTVPEARAIESDVKLFAARGEFESATFGIYPLRQLRDVRVKVGDLTNDKGETFSHQNIDVRFVKYLELPRKGARGLRYVVKPHILVASEKITVHEGVTRQCWLTFHIPDNAAPGTYRGAIQIGAANAPTTTRGLLLMVLPFRLRTLTEDDRLIDLTISYICPRHPNIWPGTDEKSMSRRLMKGWADYGFNLGQANFSVIPRTGIKTARGKVTEIDFTHTAQWLKGWADAGVELKAVVFSSYLNSATSALIGKKVPGYRETKNEVKEFPKEYDAMFMSLAQAIDRGFKERGWPDAIFYEGGEGGGYEEGRYFEKYVHRLCHKAGVKNSLSLAGDMAYFKEIVPLVWAPFDYYFNREKYEWMKEHKKQMLFKATFSRFERGLFCWAIGAKGHHAETYVYGGFGDPYNCWSTVEFSGGCGCPSRDGLGINPFLSTERHIREGHDDARYLFHLEWLIRKANQTGNPKSLKAADKARKVLERIRDTINPDLEYYRKESGYPSNSVYQKIRWRVAREIIKLQDAMKNAE